MWAQRFKRPPGQAVRVHWTPVKHAWQAFVEATPFSFVECATFHKNAMMILRISGSVIRLHGIVMEVSVGARVFTQHAQGWTKKIAERTAFENLLAVPELYALLYQPSQW